MDVKLRLKMEKEVEEKQRKIVGLLANPEEEVYFRILLREVFIAGFKAGIERAVEVVHEGPQTGISPDEYIDAHIEAHEQKWERERVERELAEESEKGQSNRT